MGGCHSVSAAPGSGVCWEARDGECVMYREMGADEGHSIGGGRHRARDSMQGAERVKETMCTQGSNNCKTCGATIGADTYCSACNGENYAPVDGVCVDASTSPGNTFCTKGSSGTCSTCKGASFMYQGGCYQAGASSPGNTLCTAASEGKCTKAAEGHFVPPGADNTHQSVVSCGDAANGVTLGDKKYVGVANCAKCNAPGSLSAAGTKAAMCTECAAGFLHASSEGATSCVETCPEGYFGHTASDTKKTCQSCATGASSLTPSVTGIEGCISCTYTESDPSVLTCSECEQGKKPSLDGTSCNTCKDTHCASCSREGACQKCTNSLYLKTETDGATSCVSKCPDGYFGHTATDDDLKTCQSCSGTNDNLDLAGTGVDGCAVCTYASNKVTCTKCEAGKYLKTTSDSTSCVEASGCGPGFFPKADDKAGNRCVPCGEAGSGGIADCQICSLVPYKQNLSYSHQLLCAADWVSIITQRAV